MTERPSPRPRPVPVASFEIGPTPGPPVEPPVEPVADGDPAQRPTRVARTRARRRRSRTRRRGVAVVACAVTAALTALVLLVVQDARQTPSAAAGTRTGSGSAGTAAAVGSGAQLLHPDLATAYLAGAVSDITAVTAYDYRRLDDALSAGLSVTTGSFRAAFQAALTGSAAEQLRTEHTTLDFQLLSAGIGSMSADGDEAKVLVFGTETVTSDALPGGTQTSQVALLATVERHGEAYLIADLQTGGNAGLPPGTPDLAAAAEAGREETLAITTYRRAGFSADYRRAESGAVDPLSSQLAAGRTATRTALTQGRYDVAGAVTAVAIESAAGDTVVMLVAVTTTRTFDAGTSDQTGAQYEVTVVHAGGTWVTSRITPVQAG